MLANSSNNNASFLAYSSRQITQGNQIGNGLGTIFSIQNRGWANSNLAHAYVKEKGPKIEFIDTDIAPTSRVDIQRKNPILVRRNLPPEVTTLHHKFISIILPFCFNYFFHSRKKSTFVCVTYTSELHCYHGKESRYSKDYLR